MAAVATAVTTGPKLKNRGKRTRPEIKVTTSKKDHDDTNSSSLTSSDDPLRILAPGQKKLTTIESQRVLGVVDETMKRLDIAMIIPHLASGIERFSVSLGVEIVTLLEEYNYLVAEYNKLINTLKVNELPAMDSFSSQLARYESGITPLSIISEETSTCSLGLSVEFKPMKGEVISRDRFDQIRFRLRMNVKCILRELSRINFPTTIPSIEKQRGAQLFQDDMSKLRAILLRNLLTTHTEEVKRNQHLEEVRKRHLSAEKQIIKLEEELTEEQRKKTELVMQKNEEIRRLKATIKGVVNLAEDGNRRIRQETHDNQTHNQNAYNVKAAKLKEEIGNLKKKQDELTKENQVDEQKMRKRTFKRETELENWIQKYDHEMGEKQDELEELEEEYTTEKAQLKELEEKLEILTIEYGGVIKDKEEARKKEEDIKMKRTQMTRAARLIQRAWKAYFAKKKALKGKKKGKKKGKGKGKGKGKKGKGKGKKGKGKS